MTNKEVYEYGKCLRETLRYDETKVRTLRRLIRYMNGCDMITDSQRDYLVGIILKEMKSCLSGFYIAELRKYY